MKCTSTIEAFFPFLFPPKIGSSNISITIDNLRGRGILRNASLFNSYSIIVSTLFHISCCPVHTCRPLTDLHFPASPRSAFRAGWL